MKSISGCLTNVYNFFGVTRLHFRHFEACHTIFEQCLYRCVFQPASLPNHTNSEKGFLHILLLNGSVRSRCQFNEREQRMHPHLRGKPSTLNTCFLLLGNGLCVCVCVCVCVLKVCGAEYFCFLF